MNTDDTPEEIEPNTGEGVVADAIDKPDVQLAASDDVESGQRASAPEGDVLLSVTGIEVHFPIKQGIVFDRTVGMVRAVDGVDLEVRRRSTLGIVGESGCGKSTLGRAILGLEQATAGSVRFDGVDLTTMSGERLRKMRRRMQMVFQDPMASLNPRQNVESILTSPLRAHRIDFDRVTKVRELLDAVGLPAAAARRYPHEFSGGQRQRLGIARAIALEPDLIIADEPVSALDVSIQAQVMNLLAELQERLGLTYIVIAHDLAVVRHLCDDVSVMYLGGIVEHADSDVLYQRPMHPYTKALISAVPIPDPVVEDRRERILLHGDLPSPASPPSGCRFHTRCPYRQATRCDTERPPLVELETGHHVACHWALEIEAGTIQPADTAFEPALADPTLLPSSLS